MRIGIDIRSLIFTRAGISSYTCNLIKSLAEIDKENEYILFCNTKSQYNWAGYDNIKEKVLRLPHLGSLTERIWEEIFLPRGIASMEVDIFHGPRFTLPSKKPCKFIVTIHDLAFKKFPQLVTRGGFNYFNAHVESAVKKADGIIAVSYNTREDLVNLFDVDGNRIEVIYEGIDENYHIIEDRKELKEAGDRYGLPEKFILFVGTVEPRKNLVRLIEAFNKLKMKKLIEHSLVIAGGKGWLYNDVFETVERLKLEQDVIFTGYIPESDLPLIYNLADLFVYPSLYEGFGLPPLEAMACGVPVITSNVSSLPEVAGDAALLVDPCNVPAIAGLIEQVLGNNGLREKMIEKGFERAGKFSWEDAAKKTMTVYREVVENL